jgi:transposase
LLWRARHNKKNWLFIGEANAEDRSAILYAIIESCRQRGIEPYAYLREVLTRLPHMTNHQNPESFSPLGPRHACKSCGELHHNRQSISAPTLLH